MWDMSQAVPLSQAVPQGQAVPLSLVPRAHCNHTGCRRVPGHLSVINHNDQQQNHNKARHPTEINETSLINLFFFTQRKTSENRRGEADAFSPSLLGCSLRGSGAGEG